MHLRPPTGGILQLVSRIYDGILNALKALACVVVLAIFVLIVLDVLLPLVGLRAWEGTHGAVEYGLLWFTLLAAPWLARTKGHVFVDALTQFLGPTSRLLMAKLAYLIVIAAACAAGYFSTDLLIEAYVDGQVDERGVELMNWWLYAPMPVGFFLVAIEFLRFLIGIDDMYGSRTDVKEGM